MFKKALPFLLALAALLLPELASAAATLKPVNGNSWTLYVFGNGDAIFNILNSIKMLMVPDEGNSGYNSLMMFLATVGFLVLAVQAGFDPGKNLLKMFTYILMVSAVHITTMEIRANIIIRDPVTNYTNAVDNVPALVGVPAALVSEVGHYFTETVETYYTVAGSAYPNELKVSAGQFNLFGRLMEEANQFTFTDPDLKKSLSAYTADCVVPAMARGVLTANELMSTTDMMKTLAKAQHKAILTKYWPLAGNKAVNTTDSTITGPDGTTYPVEGGLGAVIPCEAAWGFLSNDPDGDIVTHASALIGATQDAWSKTGIMVPFETGMAVAMGMASNGGANAFANYSKPQGLILQQAFLNSMNGNFRSAASSIGNNNLLMEVAIAQAEQSQKSSWATAARVFDNMMGYVYTTLQAFIFAIVPIVIISLMVPGLGKSIFTNYAQILVWMTLWQPMLAIVNFLITLFANSQIGAAAGLSGGVSMQNKAIITQATSDMMLAAQFLGTSVPLLTWGLVKGSLAFTEFISHGIGSSMAQQAGATAATGNMSMGNMSMDNTSMNKFNTAMSSAVGSQSTMGYTGSMQSAFDRGGVSDAQNGAAITRVASIGMTQAEQASLSKGINASESAGSTLGAMHNESVEKRHALDNSASVQKMASVVENFGTAYQAAHNASDSQKAAESQQAARETALAAVKSAQATLKAGVDAEWQVGGAVGNVVKGLSGAGVKVKAGAEFSTGRQMSRNETERALAALSSELSTSLGHSTGTTTSGGQQEQAGTTRSGATGETRGAGESVGDSRSVQELLQSAQGRAESIQHGLSATLQSGVQMQANMRPDDSQVRALSAVNANTPGAVTAAVHKADSDTGVSSLTPGGVGAARAHAQGAHDHSPASRATAAVGAGPSRGDPKPPANSVSTKLDGLKTEVAAHGDSAQKVVSGKAGNITKANAGVKDKIFEAEVVRQTFGTSNSLGARSLQKPGS